jgi:serine/threonine-protein kinase RsbW
MREELSERIQQNLRGLSFESTGNRGAMSIRPRDGDGHVQSITLTIPAKAEYITLGRLALTGIARLRAQPMSQEVLGDLKLALTEACTNSVRHAYGDSGGLVEIVYELHADRLVVEVADHGEGFEPPPGAAALVEVKEADAELSEGGLGIAIIEALSDEFEIREGDRGGSRLRFVKRLG